MSSLYNAVNTKNARTKNGAVTNSTSLDVCVDLFAQIGSSRGKDLTVLFEQALASEPEIATRILLYSRDIREGQGERGQFINLMKVLMDSRPEYVKRIIPLIPVLGRWKDLLMFIGTPFQPEVIGLFAAALNKRDGLAAKWLPRINKVTVKGGQKIRTKRKEAVIIAKELGLNHQEYRKLIASLSNTVEQKMCAKDWSGIDFSKIPSVAHSRYVKAFKRNAEESYTTYLSKLEKGETKINAAAVYPYDVLKLVKSGEAKTADPMWKALPDYIGESNERFIPVIDVSSSMNCSTGVAGVDCMEIAISLGLYLSERNKGIFKDMFFTFNHVPQMLQAKGTLSQRYRVAKSAPWGGSTNLAATFKLMLDAAIKNKVSEDEMPTKLIVLSDMEFNRTGDLTAIENARKQYEAAGYKMPTLVFWNLNARAGNSPATVLDKNVCMVSGFSPSIMRSLLSQRPVTPRDTMLETIMNERYSF